MTVPTTPVGPQPVHCYGVDQPQVTASPAAGPAPAAAVATEIVGGVTVNAATGEIVLDHLVPQGAAIELGPEMNGVVFPVESLNLTYLNEHYNPWKDFKPLPDSNPPETPPGGLPVIGPFTDPSAIFNGKTFIPIRSIMTGVIKAQNENALAAMQPLLDALAPFGILDMPVHQYPIPGTQGNLIVYYGGTRQHDDIDKLVHHMGKSHMRVLKQKCHFDKQGNHEASQGGSIGDIAKEGVGGATHCGGLSAGFANGNPATAKSDWPYTYGKLDDGAITYNANLLAVDYSLGTHDPIPERDLAAYKLNADLWDCCAGMLVPFATDNYKFNPLEIHDQTSLQNVAKCMANMNVNDFLNQCGSFYCAEGQYSVANLGPQEATLLKKSTWGETPFGRIIAKFAEAPEYVGQTQEYRRLNPIRGWDYLLAARLIDDDHYKFLKGTDRLNIALEFIPEDVKGWQAYRPKNAEGLIARPMTVATLAWGHLGRYMPREAMAKLFMVDINRAWQNNTSLKGLVSQLISGADPATLAGQKALAAFAGKIGTGVLVGVFDSKETRALLLDQAGYNQIPSPEDRRKVDDAYDQFVFLLKQAAGTGTKEALQYALLEADKNLSKLKVTRKVTNFAGQDAYVESLMLYAAPQCFGIWAQNPLLADTGCIRYVATAMHEEQKTPAAVA